MPDEFSRWERGETSPPVAILSKLRQLLEHAEVAAPQAPSEEAEDFAGNTRYQLIRKLGGGANGIVFEVADTERSGQRVALKVLRSRDPAALVRIKREFRILADVNHPNLVALYDLVAEGETWFFTLELVEGVEFLSWVWSGGTDIPRDAPTAELGSTHPSPAPAARSVDRPRLVSAFRQLALGVSAVHGAGRLHRDLKPSNVMVTAEGRVVILDFGLVSELDGEGSITEHEGQSIVGTAHYMAPEAAARALASAGHRARAYAESKAVAAH